MIQRFALLEKCFVVSGIDVQHSRRPFKVAVFLRNFKRIAQAELRYVGQFTASVVEDDEVRSRSFYYSSRKQVFVLPGKVLLIKFCKIHQPS